MSKLGLSILAVIFMATLIPFVFVARSRASKSSNSAIHLVLDMDDQPKKKAQSPSPVFKDGRAMRPHIEGTLAKEDLFLEPEMLNDADNPRLVNGSDTPISLANPTVYAALTLGRIRPPGMTDEQFNATKPNSKATDDEIASDTQFYVKTIPSQLKVTPDF